ncbi:hypothetical protein [Nocardia sp. GAS34]|uniref:hypothetical protein n=1 Tax=unclassified Nocardia TaxID=2637762 RepID=UPI003D1DC3BE
MDPIESASFGHPEGDPRALLYFEWRQRRESGYVVDDFGEEVRDLTCTGTLNTAACWRLLDRVEAAPRDPAWQYRENGAGAPLHSPTSQAPSTDHPLRSPTPPTHLYDRILGGWLGRCVGCTLGRPLANGSTWTPRHIRTYLERTDAYPLIDYVPVSQPDAGGLPAESELAGIHAGPRRRVPARRRSGLHRARPAPARAPGHEFHPR